MCGHTESTVTGVLSGLSHAERERVRAERVKLAICCQYVQHSLTGTVQWSPVKSSAASNLTRNLLSLPRRPRPSSAPSSRHHNRYFIIPRSLFYKRHFRRNQRAPMSRFCDVLLSIIAQLRTTFRANRSLHFWQLSVSLCLTRLLIF